MFDPEQRVDDIFRRALAKEEIDDDPVLAIKFSQMAVATELMGWLSHEICLGIRYGLFGKDAGDNSSIRDLPGAIGDLADAIGELADAIGGLKP